MLDIGATELLLIVVVAVIVIGPKDLPLALRTAGKWIGKMRRMSNHFRSGLDAMIREAEMEEMEKKWREQNERIKREHAADALPEPEPTGALPAPAVGAGAGAAMAGAGDASGSQAAGAGGEASAEMMPLEAQPVGVEAAELPPSPVAPRPPRPSELTAADRRAPVTLRAERSDELPEVPPPPAPAPAASAEAGAARSQAGPDSSAVSGEDGFEAADDGAAAQTGQPAGDARR